MNREPTVVFDMDGVIATGTREKVYSEKAGWAYECCTPIQTTIDLMNDLREEGIKLVINTARWEDDRAKTIIWLAEHEVPYDELLMGKPSADLYIDDKNYPMPFLPAEDNDVDMVLAQIQINREEKWTNE